MNTETFAPDRWRRRRLQLLSLLLAFLLLGCSQAPVHETPELTVASHWKHEPEPGWVNTQALGDFRWQQAPWWQFFKDDELDALMQQLETGNQDLARAVANVRAAEALVDQATAQLFPRVDGQLSTQRSGREPTRSSSSLGLSASWEPDVWGRLEASAQAQEAGLQARRADLAGARLSAQSALALAYISLRASDAEIRLLESIISAYERNVEIVGNRYESGIVARTDLLQARSTLANTRATLQGVQAARVLYEHALALLVGQAPANFHVEQATWRPVAAGIPLVLPSELLLRRPDIASAERELAAGNARLGVARAAFFPSFGIQAGLGGNADKIGQLFSSSVLAWSLGLNATQLLFDAGARRADVAQAEANIEALSAQYRQTALTAFAEVEDELSNIHALEQERLSLSEAAETAQGAEQRIMNSYEAGLSSYTDVVTAQTSALNARRSVLQTQARRQQAMVRLIAALGGGWQSPLTPQAATE